MTNSKIKKIGFTNYKSFQGEHEIELENLTLLYGYNNSGKSALVRLVKLVADSAKLDSKQRYIKSVINYASESLRGGTFENLVSYGQQNLGFTLCWDNGYLKFTLQQEGLDNEIISRLELNEDGITYRYNQNPEEKNTLESKEDSNKSIRYSGLSFEGHNETNEKVKEFSYSAHWISPTRKQPPREFDVGLGTALEISHDGEGVAEMIWYLSEKESESFSYINDWLRKSCNRVISTDYSTIIKSRRGKKRVELVTIPAENKSGESGLKVSILDSGEGIAQALPIVTLCAMAANGELGDHPIVVVEQPELHLHPKASVELAKFIVDCIKRNNNATFLLETHSESFMRAIQLAIVSSKLGKAKVNAYWICKEKNTSSLHAIKFDDKGHMSGNVPNNLFRENIDFTREVAKKREELNDSRAR